MTSINLHAAALADSTSIIFATISHLDIVDTDGVHKSFSASWQGIRN